ncbi:MAG: hypothetical protein ACK4NC_02965 [Candidatus Gracilibacteria bacterium]
MNSSTTRNLLLAIFAGILVIATIFLLSRYVFFKPQFDKWEQDLNNLATWEQEYRLTHPNATDEEVDAAFKTGIAGMEQWKKEYKASHPTATDAEVDQALRSSFEEFGKNLEEYKKTHPNATDEDIQKALSNMGK